MSRSVSLNAWVLALLVIGSMLIACLGEEGGSSGDPEPCVVDDDCTDDGLFCNGGDQCEDSICVEAGNPCAGSTPICDEALNICESDL